MSAYGRGVNRIGDRAYRAVMQALNLEDHPLLALNLEDHPPNERPMTKLSELNENTPWWDACSPPYYGGGCFEIGWVRTGLDCLAIAGQPPRLSLYKDGAPSEPLQYYDTAIKAMGGKIVSENLKLSEGKSFVRRYVFPSGAVELNFDGDASLEFESETNSPELNQKFSELAKTLLEKPPAGRVSVMISTQHGPEFQSLGIGGHNIERGNYEDHVLQAFDKIIADLKSNAPSGRLSIFNGPPGGGKTFLVKAILQAADNSVCVIVPSNMLQELSSPSVIPSLIELRRSKGKEVPIVFMVEDADECLVTRADGNMSAISAVLNLCDGIIGSLLDIRIVATTNADKMQLDKALIRPGRLSANVEIQALPFDKALEILRRITNNPEAELPETRKFTLAELYCLAKDGTVRAVGVAKETKGRMGFGA